MQASASRPNVPTSRPPADAAAAFRELHGPRLHGFALLLTLGDRALAARLAADAVAAGSARAAELHHPERAAAWLRRHVVARAPRNGRRVSPRSLAELGIDGGAFAGLLALRRRERAALIADTVERLDRGDVGTITGLDGRRLDRCLRAARKRFSAAASAVPLDETYDAGPIVMRVRAIASRALG